MKRLSLPFNRPLRMKETVTFLVTLTAAWAFLVGLVILNIGVPRTRTQWIIAVIAGPPLYVGADLLFGKLFSKERGEKISAKPFSWLRILVALAVMLVIFGTVVAISLETHAH